MSAFWHDPQSERLVAAHLNGARPAWVWEAESERRVWNNRAAIVYEATHRREPGDSLVPVPRQIPRTVRMGLVFGASRSRLQFAIGRKPISETCTCTPLYLGGKISALLVVMQTPLSGDELAGTAVPPESIAPFIGRAGPYALVGADGSVLADNGDGARRLAEGETPAGELATGADSRLVFFADLPAAASTEPGQNAVAENEAEPGEETLVIEPAAPEDRRTEETSAETPPVEVEGAADEAGSANRDALVSLIDQLDSREVLYQPLGEQDDGVFAPQRTDDATHTDAPDAAPVGADAAGETEPAEVIEPDSDSSPEARADEADAPADTTQPPARKLWKVVGRGLSLLQGGKHESAPERGSEAESPAAEPVANAATEDDAEHDPLSIIDAIARSASQPPLSETEPPQTGGEAEDEDRVAAASPQDGEEPATSDFDDVTGRIADLIGAPDAEIEQTSRYNFDELSRILNDRVSGDPEAHRNKPDVTDATNAGALVNLGDENLILNRLPIGLLVFRDQQILFNNRAFTDLLGHVDATSLRRTGLSGVFPPDGDQESAGPVTRLMGADGRVLSVSARLQVISWQGRPALLLSATRHQEPPNAEDMARTFAAFMAKSLDFGYFETSRAGILTSISGQAAILSHRRPDALINRPVHSMIALSEGARLRSFLEQPARFAGGERPSMRFEGAHPGSEIIIFAEGMAGIVTGYFGFIRTRAAEMREHSGHGIDPDFLIRLARAMRQPINAIVGFAEMIRNEAFGPIAEERYTDYGRFIHGAGRDIAGMIDELEDYARLRDEDFPLAVARLNLIDLLASAMNRVRPYAAATRVFVRSSISTSLPDISADGETLVQAVLNILATAIAHSPTGGQVVLSARKRGDGAIEVHVRDSGHNANESVEDSFMVFRDGEAADGETLTPMPSAIGFALTRTLLTVNSVDLDIDPDRGSGVLFSLIIPAELVMRADSLKS